ncbi:diaminobutyrate acetyltransferase [Paenibacillus sp. HB172176]|uniref:diaminobutyrate acetyltransferase n=1 Tax=Paenibacillus sp. HB172176 TaxID=2493690 RepID=UPI001F10E16A|nr:diaminobutyrate acetyltransferase [Paenibacillus sp. HB172176]
MTETAKPQLHYRKPSARDGGSVWELIRDAKTLDLNSSYSYLMLCDMFQDTCCLAETGEELAGFVSAFRKPSDPNTLFVWQIGVSSAQRGKGIGKGLIKALLSRPENADISFMEATIGPDNIASRQLFMSLSNELGGSCNMSEHFDSTMFPGEKKHDDELLFRIGPLKLDRISAPAPSIPLKEETK